MNKQGFTLIELLIYVAVMSLAIVSLASWSLSISGSEQRAVVGSELQAGGRFVAEQVSRQARQAEVIVYPLAGETNSSVKFDLGLPDGVVVSVVDERLVLSNGVDSWPLTSEQLEVKNFSVTNRSSSARQSHLDFALTLVYREAASREYAVEKTFNFSASSRR